MVTSSATESFRYNNFKPFPLYKSRKRVWALEVDTIGNANGYGDVAVTFKDKNFDLFYVDDLSVLQRYMPKSGDFYVRYEDGGYAFVPRKSFLAGYELV